MLFSLCLAVCVTLSSAPAECLPAASACPQDARQQPVGHVLRSEVNLQTVDVQVTDKRGSDVRGLTANDFTIREDGKRQEIAFFDAGAASVTVAVLVDSSTSVSQDSKVGSAEQVAAQFMRIARPGDDIYAMDFTEHTGPLEHLTAEQLRNPGTVTVPSASGSGSAVYDAIAAAICHLRDSKNPRQAIVVIADGVDEHSRLTLNQLVDVVRSQRAQLFLIGLQSRPQFRFSNHIDPTVTLVTGHDIDNPEYVFYRLAKEAGAATFELNSENSLRKALKAVSDVLDAEYTIAYYPPSTPHKLRKIEVKVSRHGLRVLGSRTVVSNQDSGEIVNYLPGTCMVSSFAYPYPYEARISGEPGHEIYRDDFSDPHSGWPTHPDSHYVIGGYNLSTAEQGEQSEGVSIVPMGAASMGMRSEGVSATKYRQDVIAAYGPPWRAFRVSATVKADYEPRLRSDARRQFLGPVHAAAGLVFRISWKGYYALLVGPSAEHKKRLAFELVARTFRGDSYTESMIVPWTTVPQDSPLEAQLAVQDIGNQITLFIDGQRAGTARDDRFDNGYAGFIVSAPAHATFSNFLLEQK
jgi:Ca-activated chloride channel homolog